LVLANMIDDMRTQVFSLRCWLCMDSADRAEFLTNALSFLEADYSWLNFLLWIYIANEFQCFEVFVWRCDGVSAKRVERSAKDKDPSSDYGLRVKHGRIRMKCVRSVFCA